MTTPESAPRTEAEQVVALAAFALQTRCHAASHAAGWWTDAASGADLAAAARDPNTARDPFQLYLLGTKIALVHSEISEALEGLRTGAADLHLPHRASVEVELADAIIRIADLAGAMGLDLGGAIVEKMAYNAERSDHKVTARLGRGGKAF